MRLLFEKIKKKHEDKLIAKAKELEAERLKQEEEMLAKVNEREEYIKKLLNSKVPTDFILRLRHEILDKNGKFKHYIYDYFLCDTKREDLKYGDRFQAIKVSGNNFGKKFDLQVYSSSYSLSLTEVQLNDVCGYWVGDIRAGQSIPTECDTIAELNDFANQYNATIKQEYEEKVEKRRQEEQQIQNQFFK